MNENETKFMNRDGSMQNNDPSQSQPSVTTRKGKAAILRNIGMVGAGVAAGGLFLGLSVEFSDDTDKPFVKNDLEPVVGNNLEPVVDNSPELSVGNSPEPGVENSSEASVDNSPEPGVENSSEAGVEKSPEAEAHADSGSPAIDAPIPVPENLHIATSVTEGMRFGEAFAAARAEVGAGGYFMYNKAWYGTYNAEEWATMSVEEKKSFSEAIFHHPNHEYFAETGDGSNVTGIVIHDVAPVATWVNDGMPIADAHLIARIEVGAGGIFIHDGKTYSTYYPSELAQMTPEQHQLFIDSIANADVSTVIYDSGVDVGDMTMIEIDADDPMDDYETTDLQAPVEGEVIDDTYFEMDDGTVVYGELIDTDDNGIPDVARLTNTDTDEKVEIVFDEETNEVIEVRSVGDSSIDNPFLPSNNPNYDDFDPNADMTNWG